MSKAELQHDKELKNPLRDRKFCAKKKVTVRYVKELQHDKELNGSRGSAPRGQGQNSVKSRPKCARNNSQFDWSRTN